MKENREINIEEVAKTIGVPVEEWSGKCHQISALILQHKVVTGKLRYGHWVGPVSGKSMFAKYPSGLVRHGWIELEDGRIVDPTRFEFEQKKPYIYIGKDDYYDAGGNKFRLDNLKPTPEYDASEKQVILKVENYDALYLLLGLFVNNHGSYGEKGQITITIKQAFWLSNLPLQAFEGLAKPIYEALIEAKLGAFIPYDNKKMVMEG